MLSLGGGFLIGVARLLAEINKDSLSGIMYEFATINFLHFALFLFVVCSVILILGSLLAPAPDAEKIAKVTYHKIDEGSDRKTDAILSIVLVIMILILWAWFS